MNTKSDWSETRQTWARASCHDPAVPQVSRAFDACDCQEPR